MLHLLSTQLPAIGRMRAEKVGILLEQGSDSMLLKMSDNNQSATEEW